MTAPSKNFTSIADAAIDSGSPLTAELMTQIRDSLVHLEEWLGKDYIAAQNHSHNGIDSALIAIGPNWMRNGGFEDGLSNWTTLAYTGGTVGITNSNETEGIQGAFISSTVAANGGGYLNSDEYIPVIAGQVRQFMVTVMASGSTVPIKAQAIWYDDAKAQISVDTIINITTSPTTSRLVVRRISSPATAKYVRVKLELPPGAGGTGSVYFDGVTVGLPHMLGGEQVFTGNGTFSAVWGDVIATVQGGGAGCDGTTNGGGGGYASGPVTTSADITVTVGASVSNASGNSSSFGSLMSATGGTKGAGTGATGGTGTGGSINISGSNGAAGGASFLSGSTPADSNGSNYGGGAVGGGGSNRTGAQGIVIVRW